MGQKSPGNFLDLHYFDGGVAPRWRGRPLEHWVSICHVLKINDGAVACNLTVIQVIKALSYI